MPRFFVEDVSGDEIIISGPDAVHIGRSLRMRLGDEIIICCKGMEYRSEILTISDSGVMCRVLSCGKSKCEPNVRLTLFQAMPKSDKLEFIVQKAVELGAAEICPVLTARCVSRPDEKSFRKKLERLNKIALEAAKQCGRGVVPKVTEMISFNECVERLKACDIGLMCYENGGINLREAEIESGKSIGLFIGSEGGFEPDEAGRCADEGIRLVGLGNRILRCETAPIAALSIIMNLTGNM